MLLATAFIPLTVPAPPLTIPPPALAPLITEAAPMLFSPMPRPVLVPEVGPTVTVFPRPKPTLREIPELNGFPHEGLDDDELGEEEGEFGFPNRSCKRICCPGTGNMRPVEVGGGTAGGLAPP